MTVYVSKRLRCNDCGYEEPNDYYFGRKKWIEVEDSEEDEKVHFCSDGCFKSYQNDNPNALFFDRKEIDNSTVYLNEYKES